MDVRFIPRGGALRYKDARGEWVCANPHDTLYSTVTMCATEYYHLERGWVPIYADGEGSNVE